MREQRKRQVKKHLGIFQPFLKFNHKAFAKASFFWNFLKPFTLRPLGLKFSKAFALLAKLDFSD